MCQRKSDSNVYDLFLSVVDILIFVSSRLITDETKLLKVKKLEPDAVLPRRGTKRSAGFDLHSGEDVKLLAKKRAVVKTSIAMELPQNTYGKISSRSGLAFHSNVFCFNGILDQDFNSEILLLMLNESDNDFFIKKGDRIAQLIIQSYESNIEIKEVSELKKNQERNGKGFGSTGIRPLNK